MAPASPSLAAAFPAFASVAATVSGNTIFFASTAVAGNAGAAGQIQTAYLDDLYAYFPITVLAGADTVLTSCSVNGSPGQIVCQVNRAGLIAAIVMGKVSFPMGFLIGGTTGTATTLVINTTGTAPTAGRTDNCSYVVRYPEPDWYDATSDAVNTTLTHTIPVVGQGQRVVSCAANDVTAAQSCTWTGTAGHSEDNQEGNTSTYRRSFAEGAGSVGTSRTIISTWAVTSVAAIVMASALVRLK